MQKMLCTICKAECQRPCLLHRICSQTFAPSHLSIPSHNPLSQRLQIITLPTPLGIPDLTDSQPPIDVPVQHLLYQFDIRGRHDPRYAQFVIEYFVNAVEGVFLVDERVEEDAEGPDVLFFAAVGFALEDFRRCVI